MEKLKGKVFPVFITDDGKIHSLKLTEEQYQMFEMCMRAVLSETGVVVKKDELVENSENRYKLEYPEKQKEI